MFWQICFKTSPLIHLFSNPFGIKLGLGCNNYVGHASDYKGTRPVEPIMIKDISVLLNAVGVGNCFLLSYTYLIKKESKTLQINHILSCLFFVMGILILNTILNFSGYAQLLYGFEPLSNAFAFAIAPLLYLYKAAASQAGRKLSVWSGHLVFFYVILAWTMISLVLPTSLLGQWGQLFMESKWAILLWNFHFLAYLIVMGNGSLKSRRRLPNPALFIIYGTVSIWVFNLMFFLYRTWIHPLPNIVYLNITLLFSLMTIYLFYKKFRAGDEAEGKQPPKRLANFVQLNKATDPIMLSIREQKYYKNPELNIRTLSEQLQIPYHELSSWINQHYGQNFNTFINSFRIKEVVRALETRQHQSFTIIGLAQKAGFKSASAFYAAFKKEMGTTPSDFLKQIT